jgi:hypothetical protein
MTDQVLANEIAEAQQLARAMALSNEIIPEDYSILPHILEEFCSPEMICSARTNKGFRWLQQTKEVEQWLSALDADSNRLQSRLSYYSC